MASTGAFLFTRPGEAHDYPLVYKPGDDTNMVFTVVEDKDPETYPEKAPVMGHPVKIDVYYV
jgi:hypothetical protein